MKPLVLSQEVKKLLNKDKGFTLFILIGLLYGAFQMGKPNFLLGGSFWLISTLLWLFNYWIWMVVNPALDHQKTESIFKHSPLLSTLVVAIILIGSLILPGLSLAFKFLIAVVLSLIALYDLQAVIIKLPLYRQSL